MRRVRLCLLMTVAGLAAVDVATVRAQSSVSVRQAQPTGAIAGIVRDANGAPLADVRVLIEGLTRQTRTSSVGGFVLEGLLPGTHIVRFRKLGFQEAWAEIPVIADSGVTVGVTMSPIAEQLDTMVIAATVLNQVTGLVTDENGTPMPGVVVEILGLNMRLETNADGRYILLDLKPGSYLLQFRAPGYRVGQYGLRMVAQIERDITTKMRRATSSDRMTAAVAAAVALEANRRQSLRGAQSMILGRDELERYDTAPLGDILANTRVGLLLPDVNTSCILVNGHEPLSAQSVSEQLETWRPRETTAPTSFGAAQRSTPSPMQTNALVKGGWINFFRANEIELLEVYAEGSDNSQTLCGRFPPSSGCSCPPAPSALVIWLRR